MADRIPGEFVPLDVNAPYDRSLRMAGPSAELLFYRGLMWARKHKTGGHLADFNLAEIGAGIPAIKKYADALVRERLWLKARGGWQIRSFEKWNPEPDRAAQGTGGRLGNHNRWHTDGKWSPDCEFCGVPPEGIGTESVADRSTDEKRSVGTDRLPIASPSLPIAEGEKREERERKASDSPSSSLLRYVPREAGAQR